MCWFDVCPRANSGNGRHPLALRHLTPCGGSNLAPAPVWSRPHPPRSRRRIDTARESRCVMTGAACKSRAIENHTRRSRLHDPQDSPIPTSLRDFSGLMEDIPSGVRCNPDAPSSPYDCCAIVSSNACIVVTQSYRRHALKPCLIGKHFPGNEPPATSNPDTIRCRSIRSGHLHAKRACPNEASVRRATDCS